MKKTAIGIVAVLAMSSMAFGINSILLDDITIDPGSSGVMTLSVQGPDLSAGFTIVMFVHDWVVNVIPHPDINAFRFVPWNPNGGVWDIDDIFDARNRDDGEDPLPAFGIVSSSADMNFKSIVQPANLLHILISVPAGTPAGWYDVVDLNQEVQLSTAPGGPTGAYDDPMDVGDGIGRVYVTPEPVSALLLALGGLFLRRRR